MIIVNFSSRKKRTTDEKEKESETERQLHIAFFLRGPHDVAAIDVFQVVLFDRFRKVLHVQSRIRLATGVILEHRKQLHLCALKTNDISSHFYYLSLQIGSRINNRLVGEFNTTTLELVLMSLFRNMLNEQTIIGHHRSITYYSLQRKIRRLSPRPFGVMRLASSFDLVTNSGLSLSTVSASSSAGASPLHVGGANVPKPGAASSAGASAGGPGSAPGMRTNSLAAAGNLTRSKTNDSTASCITTKLGQELERRARAYENWVKLVKSRDSLEKFTTWCGKK